LKHSIATFAHKILRLKSSLPVAAYYKNRIFYFLWVIKKGVSFHKTKVLTTERRNTLWKLSDSSHKVRFYKNGGRR
jgi:hypothetical protein